MNVIERVRLSGQCPPSLLPKDIQDESFEIAVAKILDANDLSLATGGQVADAFASLMQMASSTTATVMGDETKKILSQRRSIILSIIGSTPSSNDVLSQVLQNGFLATIKSWLDEVLNGSIGEIDLLLHLLTNITKLPVTKSVVKDSGMGKVIGSIEKHKLCAGTPNEIPLKQRVKEIKYAWNKSVKELKDKDTASSGPTQSQKREAESTSATGSSSSPISKKARLDNKQESSFSSLLKKVTPVATAKTASSVSELEGEPSGDADKKTGAKKQQSKRVKWSDHFGGNLNASKIVDGDDSQGENGIVEKRNRDRLRERELIANAKKSKLIDDDDDMGMNVANTNAIQPTVAWHAPSILPERPDTPSPQVNSKEMATQATRMASVTEAQYLSDFNVPANPAPLNDVEQALDMASQTSAVVQSMPFFVPQAPPAPEPAPSPAKVHPHSYSNSAVNPPFTGGYGAPPPPSQPIPSTSGVATAEVVQSLGLPMFLVGQNVQALQTLASTPSLLSTFVDGNGMYDQARLTSLVHTLTQNITPSQQQAPSMSHLGNGGGYQQPASAPAYGSGGMQQQPFHSGGGGGGVYGPASSHYGQGQEGQKAYGGGGSGSWGQQGGGAMKSGYRGDQNNGDGNLHLSNYGPTTTQADIITLFQPYVHVDEVVMKGTFCFVNSSDPVGAKRAREALTGALLGGAPVRINMAQRKNRDGAANAGGFRNNNTSSFYGNTGASNMNPIGAMGRGNAPGMPPPKPIHGTPSGMHGAPPGGDDLANVRDDRGNPATKNLFVAGYGQGTSEQQIRELFSQYANIIGIIMKGTFSFVNTSDKRAAIQAREGLSGSSMNGGVLRINFAKETGRLGTSFDLTYRGGAAGGAGGGFRGGGGESHYGRNF